MLYYECGSDTYPCSHPPIPQTIECPLCLGAGALTRVEVLDRLGVDFARVAQLSARALSFCVVKSVHTLVIGPS